MKANTVALLIAVIFQVFIVILWWIKYSVDKDLKEIQIMNEHVIKKKQSEIDSLKSVIVSLELSFEQDSIIHANEQIDNLKRIKALQKQVYAINYKTYTNHQLDSSILSNWPGAKVLPADRDGETDN